MEGDGRNNDRVGPDGREQSAPWIEFSSRSRRESEVHIEDREMLLGTDWGPSLTMALSMEAPPQITFFMTDGAGGKNGVLPDDFRKMARRNKTIINTVVLMEPKAVDGLIYLAKETNGQCTIVDKKGRAEVEGQKWVQFGEFPWSRS